MIQEDFKFMPWCVWTALFRMHKKDITIIKSVINTTAHTKRKQESANIFGGCKACKISVFGRSDQVFFWSKGEFCRQAVWNPAEFGPKTKKWSSVYSPNTQNASLLTGHWPLTQQGHSSRGECVICCSYAFVCLCSKQRQRGGKNTRLCLLSLFITCRLCLYLILFLSDS